MITFEKVDPDRDAELLHAWVTHERSVFWDMQGASVDDVRDAYAEIDANPHHEAFVGLEDGDPLFLMERYDPAHSELAAYVEPGDVGMHVLVAPPSGPARPGLTLRVMRAVMDFCFADPSVRRVVVEPDARNEKIARLNEAVGFVVQQQVELSTKTAALSFAERPHRPRHLIESQRALVAKAIAEFAHERIVVPERDGEGWVVGRYRFRARRLPMDHWVVDPDSLPEDVDAQQFVIEHAPVPDQLMPTYLEEIASTLASSMWKREHQRHSADDLVHADFQTIESAMTEGHPGFVANNGRIGFGWDDYRAFAPECGQPTSLVRLGVRRELAHLALSESFGADEATLAEIGQDDPDYWVLPVHPWQWQHKVAITFAPDLARGDLTYLGTTKERYQPQQSIRTFFNLDRPERPYVKVALSIQNMGFMRGLSPAYMRATPAINDWVAQLVRDDEALQGWGFDVLREYASLGYTGDAYHRLPGTNPYQKMLASLWRESPMPRLAEGERVATMASLLHRDRHGQALVTSLIKASPLAAPDWVAAYLQAYLTPLVHCLYRYDLAFMPHGENLILVLEDHVPRRVFMKDIGEEVAVMGDLPLPPEVERIRADVSPDVRALAIHTDVFDGVLRFLCAILDDDGVLPAGEFWSLVRQAVDAAAPGHEDAAARYDLTRPRFQHSCLNRLQLRNTLQMVDLTSQADSLIFAGMLDNPIHR